MAGLQFRNGSYRIIFRHQGRQHAFTLDGEQTEALALAKAGEVDLKLHQLNQRFISIPNGMDICEFLKFQGRPAPAPTTNATLGQLRDKYLETHKLSLEPTTIEGIKIHFRLLTGFFGEKFLLTQMTTEKLQEYVNHRTDAKGNHGKDLSAATIKKEIVSLRTAWNWGTEFKLTTGNLPYKRLSYPKLTEKPPFMTRAEIERKIEHATAAEKADLWDALYLMVDEVSDLLKHVKKNAGQPFVYPMYCLAAHTGARRSEMIRTKVTDVDLVGKTVTITEKKRVRGKTTSRIVPLSPFLYDVLKEWLKIHPGGPYLFCHGSTVARSRKRSLTTGHKSSKNRATTTTERQAMMKPKRQIASSPLTVNEFRHHFGTRK